MTLGEQIKQARERKNLSQEELAEYIGVSRQAISKWENDTSIPQGTNRELLSKILEFELELSTTETVSNRRMIVSWLGWGIAALLLMVMILICVRQRMKEPDAVAPAIKTIRFYDENQMEVMEEALWYNAAQMDSILIQWEGGSPNNIKMFFIPSGSEMTEATELLLTKPILDGDTVALLSADTLTDITQGHLYFVLEFGGTSVASEDFNVFYDTSILED